MKKISSSSFSFIFLLCFSATTTMAVNYQDTLPSVPEGNCPAGAAQSTTWEGRCDSFDDRYIYTPQCSVTESYNGENYECTVRANACGCQRYYETDGVGYIGVYYYPGCGSGTERADSSNCATYSDNLPPAEQCTVVGSSMTFGGACDSRDYIWSTQCALWELDDPATGGIKCYVESKECGCRYYEQNSNGVGYVSALTPDPTLCNPCSIAHGSGAAASMHAASVEATSFTPYLRTRIDNFIDETFSDNNSASSSSINDNNN